MPAARNVEVETRKALNLIACSSFGERNVRPAAIDCAAGIVARQAPNHHLRITRRYLPFPALASVPLPRQSPASRLPLGTGTVLTEDCAATYALVR